MRIWSQGREGCIRLTRKACGGLCMTNARDPTSSQIAGMPARKAPVLPLVVAGRGTAVAERLLRK